MAQAHFPRGLLGRSALAPRSLRDVEDGTSLPFYSCCPQTRVRASCKPSLPFGGTRGGGRSVGCIFYPLSPTREVPVDCSVALSALLSGFRVPLFLPVPPVDRADISTCHSTSQPLSRPLSPTSSIACHVFAFSTLVFLGSLLP